MPKKIILLSGPVSSGKSTLAMSLVQRHGFYLIRTRQLISAILGSSAERLALQAAGEQLDRRTKGAWVASALAREVQKLPADTDIIVDSVRIESQVDAVREAFGSKVVHVHLTAPLAVLSRRYMARERAGELSTYEGVRSNKTEQQVERLGRLADILIDTAQSSAEDVFVRVASRLGLFGRSPERLVDVLVGGQYGSEGKGQIAAYLAPEYDILIRVGGPNAGHKVYEEPKPYTFHQLPSGTRCSEAQIILGPGAVLWLPTLQREIGECIDSPRLYIDPQAMVIDEEDRRFEEAALREQIGSTAQGVGSATSRKILRTAAKPSVRLAKDVTELKPYIRETCQLLDEAFARGRRVFLEGTQGTGLSLHHGNYPYVTSRETSVSGCLAEAGIAPSRVRRILLVCRTYPIRVEDPANQTSGPLVNEIDWQEVSRRSGVPIEELEEREVTSTTKRKRRVGEFDWNLFRRSVSLNGPTDVVLTFADYVSKTNRKARRFEQLSQDTIRLIEELEMVAAAPVSLVATRFHSRSIIDRRNW